MLTNSQNKWWPRGVALAVWALASGSALWWGLRLVGLSEPLRQTPAPAAAPVEVALDAGAVARVLGAVAVSDVVQPKGAPSRFVLLGVVAGRSSAGAALISVDGKPGRPYRVGSKIEEGLVLQAVEPRRARLAPSPDATPSVVLELPLPAK